MKHLPAPCVECSFRRDIEPGFLGGSAPEVYIGQSMGPFIVPCHKACDFDDPQWREVAMTGTPQCAGMAIYRTHVGAPTMPAAIHRLPASAEVFGSHEEFLAHHKRIPIEQARHELAALGGAKALYLVELHRPEVMVREVP